MSIKNLLFIVVNKSALSNDKKTDMMYKTFDTTQDLYDYMGIPNSMRFFGLDRLIKHLNSNMTIMVLKDEYIIPVFVKNADMDIPDILMEKLSQNEENALKTKENGVKKSFTSQIEKIYIDAYDKITKRIKEHKNSVNVGNDVYSISKSNQLMMNGIMVEDNHYGFCQRFDAINEVLDREEIIEKVLTLEVKDITTIMKTIGLFGTKDEIRPFDELTTMIHEANNLGFDVKIDIESGHDYYIYGRVLNKTLFIYGLADDFDDFNNTLNMPYWAKVIQEHPQFLSMVNKYYKEWKEKHDIE